MPVAAVAGGVPCVPSAAAHQEPEQLVVKAREHTTVGLGVWADAAVPCLAAAGSRLQHVVLSPTGDSLRSEQAACDRAVARVGGRAEVVVEVDGKMHNGGSACCLRRWLAREGHAWGRLCSVGSGVSAQW